MDLKKLVKSLGFSEQFTSKRKVLSGFGLGVIGSVLLLTVFFLNHPLKASLLYPVFQRFNGVGRKAPLVPWPFQFSSKNGTSVGSHDARLRANQTHEGIVPEFSKNSSLIGSNDGGLVSEKPQSGDLSGSRKNASFIDSSGGKLVSEKPQSGNVSQSKKDSSFGDLVSGNFTQNEKNLSASSEVGRFEEKPNQGNLSKEVNSGKNSSEEDGIWPQTHELRSGVNNRNDSFIGNSTGFTGNVGNVTESRGSMGSNATKESVVGRPQEQISKKELPLSSSNSTSFVGGGNDLAKCDIFDGRWERDEGKPYYPAGSCPYIDRDFDCHLNGRPDDDFVKWRWQPNHCNIPSLNGTDFLERLRGKRLVFVGDSMNRNMWESLVCILRQSVANKKKVYEISGKTEFKKKGFYAFHYEDYNCSVDFVSSVFLVRETPTNSKSGLTETLRLDMMDKTTPMYHDADIIVFNTGHWWTHEKTSKGENYYQEGNHVYPRLKVLEAYTKALSTWGRWIDRNVDLHKSQVFFRGYSVTHFRGGQWNSGGQCHKEMEPIYNDTFLAKYPSKMKALENVLHQMRTPVVYLNISKLTDYRKDAHPSIYRKEYKTAEEKLAAERSQDCSHWCLPGVPDTWNELLYASLLQVGRGSWGK